MWGSPIFNIQNPLIQKNHELIRSLSQHEIQVVEVFGASVEHAKQMMYKQFLESDCEYFFNVDADIYFFDQDISPLDILLSANKKVIGGIYVYKKSPCLPTHRTLDLQKYYEENKKFPKNYKFIIPKEIHEVEWLAGGCMLIHRTVIEKLVKKYLVPNLPMVHKGEYLSEDFGFCFRAKQEGYKIYADPRINLGHQGLYFFKLSDYYKDIKI